MASHPITVFLSTKAKRPWVSSSETQIWAHERFHGVGAKEAENTVTYSERNKMRCYSSGIWSDTYTENAYTL